MNQTATIPPTKMERDHKTGGFLIALTKKHKEQMAKKKIIAMCADFSGHFCMFRKPKVKKIYEQKERYATPQEAIDAVK